MTPAARDRARLLSMLAVLPDDPPSAAASLRATADVPRLLAYAHRHGVLPLLACHLGPHAPASVRAYLRDIEETRALSHAVGLHALSVALAALGEAGLNALSLKGPLLGERLYCPVFARPSLDLDLLVAPADFEAARRALANAGWRDAPGTDASTSLEQHHHVQLVSATLPSLELHFAATSAFGTRIEAAPLLARARSFRAGELEARLPDPVDEIVYLATHAAAHHVERIGWLYDLALVLRAPHDPDAILSRAAAFGVERPVHAVLVLAQRAFALPSTLPPLDRGQHAALATVAALDDPTLPEALRTAARAAFILALSATARHRVVHVARKLALRLGRARRS